MNAPPEPTPEQCANGERYTLDDGRKAIALWYPQMGGYVGKAVAVFDGCVDVYVWHDGQFPFSGDDDFRSRGPIELHHCDPSQFIRFGQTLNTFIEEQDS